MQSKEFKTNLAHMLDELVKNILFTQQRRNFFWYLFFTKFTTYGFYKCVFNRIRLCDFSMTCVFLFIKMHIGCWFLVGSCCCFRNCFCRLIVLNYLFFWCNSIFLKSTKSIFIGHFWWLDIIIFRFKIYF